MTKTERMPDKLPPPVEPGDAATPQLVIAGRIERIRALWRLLVDDADADRFARSAVQAKSPARGLAAPLPALRWRTARAWLRQRLGRAASDESRPLAPAAERTPEAALALALHLGLGLSASQLSLILHREPNLIGRDLERVRRSLDPSLPKPCDEFAAAIGRYRDATLPMTERAALLHHAKQCTACRDALDRAAALDADLLRLIDSHQRELPPLSEASGRRTLSTGIVWSALLVALLLLVATGILMARPFVQALFQETHTPVPLVAESATPELEGWLLLAAQPGLEAINLATGDSQVILYESNAQTWGFFPSPSRRLIAVWTPQRDTELEVDNLEGHSVRSWWRNETDAQLNPVGWLGESAVLSVESPAPVPGQPQPVGANRLVALDVASGEERVLFKGAIDDAVASPDGTMIALIRTTPQQPGATLELRPIGPDGLGAPLATIKQRLDGEPIWAPDSSRLYLSRIGVDGSSPAASGTGVPGQGQGRDQLPFRRADLVALDRSGQITDLVVSADGIEYVPLSVAPDNSRIYYQQITPGRRDGPAKLWRVNADGSEATRITGLPSTFIERAAWSPNGQSLLFKQDREFYLPSAGARAASDDATTRPDSLRIPTLVEVGTEDPARVVAGQIGAFSDTLRTASVIGWLPDSAISARTAPRPAATPIGGLTTAPEEVDGIAPGEQFDDTSVPSPDSRFLLLQRRDRGAPTVRDDLSGGERVLEAGATDLSWLANGQALIGVAGPELGKPAPPSRIAFFAPTDSLANSLTVQQANGQRFDPAGIGDDPSRHYARPLMSPDGHYTSVFVVDEQQGTIELWIAGWDAAPRLVTRWAAPPGMIVSKTPVATWIDRRTLIFARPTDWHDGLPRQVALEQLSIISNGSPIFTRLMMLRARGDDRGVALTELALSPNGDQLAWRLRHYTKHDAASGVYDTLSVAPASDLSEVLELARGDPGEGLQWRSDSRWLVAGLRGRVTLLSADGRSLHYLTPTGVIARNPLWVSDTEIWFTIQGQDTGGERIMRVRLL